MISIGGYTFKTKIINQALTHSSYSKNNYEKLEFLGDSILDFLVADIIFANKKFHEQELTRVRASLVSEENLSKVFDKLNIENIVKVGKSCKVITRAMKGDFIESILASIYLESGLNECKQFILNNFSLQLVDSKDFKSKLQEYAQKYKLEFKYEVNKTEGPAHALKFYIDLYINNEIVSSACATSKIDAEKECAKIALEKLNYKG